MSTIGATQGAHVAHVQENLPPAESIWSVSSLLCATKRVWATVQHKLSVAALSGSVCVPGVSPVVFSPLLVYHLGCMGLNVGGSRTQQLRNAFLCLLIAEPIIGQLLLLETIPLRRSPISNQNGNALCPATIKLRNGKPFIPENYLRQFVFDLLFGDFGKNVIEDAFKGVPLIFVEDASVPS